MTGTRSLPFGISENIPSSNLTPLIITNSMFLDIGVLTHPEFRKKGLGRAVVGAVCDWSIQHDIIAQYRHNILNTGSQNVAKSLHFQTYFKSEGISLR